MDIDDLLGKGHNGGRGNGADFVSRMNIVAESERDLVRKRERDGEPVVPMRWRFRGGAWQRWSELDREFVTLRPPDTLLQHAATAGVPDEGQELLFTDGAWVPAADRLAADDEPPPPSPPPAPAPTTAERDREAADFEVQLDAWRNRR